MPTLGNVPRPAYVYDTETDTWVPIGVGAHTHDDLYINQTVIDAKGDLLAGTADNSYGRLPVGANGTVLVSDSTTSTGLAWQPYAAQSVAGKNALINGAFQIWQRGTSLAGQNTNNLYIADRWHIYRTGATFTRQLTNDSSNLPNIQYCIRAQRDSGTTSTGDIYVAQALESINSIRFAGKIVTVSFYARKGANYSSTSDALKVWVQTGTGTDQAPINNFTGAVNGIDQTATLTTNWQRFSYTSSSPLPSNLNQIKVLFYNTPTGTAGASDYYEITGVQLEEGPIATPFTTATGTIQGELAACQRYYFRVNAFATSSYAIFGAGAGNSTTQARTIVPFPVTMRVKPTSIDYPTVGSNFAIIGYDDTINVAPTAAALDTNQSDTQSGYILWTAASGVVASRPLVVRGQATTNAYLGFNAEL